LDSTSSRGSGFFSRVTKSRKNNGSLPIPSHQRTASSPVPLIETTSPEPITAHRRFPSSIEQHHHRSLENERASFKSDSKKLSLDSHLSVDKSPKRTSSDTSDKHSKKNHSHEKLVAKRSLDEIRMPTLTTSHSGDKSPFILNTPETPKNLNATPELLAELLKGELRVLILTLYWHVQYLKFQFTLH
jgi:hypothetical protein